MSVAVARDLGCSSFNSQHCYQRANVCIRNKITAALILRPYNGVDIPSTLMVTVARCVSVLFCGSRDSAAPEKSA